MTPSHSHPHPQATSPLQVVLWNEIREEGSITNEMLFEDAIPMLFEDSALMLFEG